MQLCIDVSAFIPFCKRVLRALYALVSSKRSAPPSVSRARNLVSECVLFRNVDGDYGAGLPLPGALGAWGVFSEAQTLVCKKNTHDRAYLSIGVTCGIGARLCGESGEGDSWGIGTWLCRILQVNFREFQFHALRCIRR